MAVQMLPHIVYINLDRRTDRRNYMEQWLAEFGMSHAERFPAIEHAYGLYGCGLSHLAVLKRARDEHWEHVLVLEDDVMFRPELCGTAEKFQEKIEEIFRETGWNVFMLDMNLVKTFPRPGTGELLSSSDGKQLPESMVRVKFAHCAGAYIVKSHYYDALIELYEWALPQLLATQMHWVYANDAVWTRLQERDQWWGFREQFCIQTGGYSDTKNMVTGVGGSIPKQI